MSMEWFGLLASMYMRCLMRVMRIDVTINDSYDSSYVTNLLVCRRRRQKTCLDEFLVLDEDDLSNQRSYITAIIEYTTTRGPVYLYIQRNLISIQRVNVTHCGYGS